MGGGADVLLHHKNVTKEQILKFQHLETKSNDEHR
jgi:hypothetical protein